MSRRNRTCVQEQVIWSTRISCFRDVSIQQRGSARTAALVWLAVSAAVVGAEVRLATCAADPRLCLEATGLIHPHAPAEGTHHTFSGGVSVGDFNRDGWQDLFVVTGGEAPDRLADVDNDGLLDWYVTSIWTTSPFENPPNNGNYLYRNLGGATFDPGPETRGPLSRGGWGWGVVAADLDHDGLVELVTTNGSEDKNTDERQEWLEDATRVFHNRGAEGFRDVAPEAGLDHRGQGRGLVRFDYDNDGDQDLLIVNSRGVPTLVANTGGTASGNWLWVELRPALDLPVPPDGVGAVVRAATGGATLTATSRPAAATWVPRS